MQQESRAYEELNYRNLGDSIFMKLKEEILNGTLKPGQRLQQVELSRKYDVSRAPVRDALRKLEAEGLVTINRKGVQVSSLDLGELRELYQIREVLEDLAARKAFPFISDEDLTALTDLAEKMEKASREGDLSSWRKFDFKFHIDSYKPGNGPIILKIITGLWDSSYQFGTVYYLPPENIKRSERKHRAQLAALAARDSKLYRRLVKKHLKEIADGIEKIVSTRSSVSPKSP